MGRWVLITVTFAKIGLYAVAIFVLFLTPGPVWVAIMARSLNDGFTGAWPLALGVAVGDIMWPALALLTLGQILAIHPDIFLWLRYGAVFVFLGMGIGLILAQVNDIHLPRRLTLPGILPGFLAGLLVIIGNPKAILFYMGILPGFFAVDALTWRDIMLICLVSAMIPFSGNICLALALARAALSSRLAQSRRPINIGTGIVLMLVAIAILFG
jgi:threonine/homoserine/homoserine lactone efflux protein